MHPGDISSLLCDMNSSATLGGAGSLMEVRLHDWLADMDDPHAAQVVLDSKHWLCAMMGLVADKFGHEDRAAVEAATDLLVKAHVNVREAVNAVNAAGDTDWRKKMSGWLDANRHELHEAQKALTNLIVPKTVTTEGA